MILKCLDFDTVFTIFKNFISKYSKIHLKQSFNIFFKLSTQLQIIQFQLRLIVNELNKASCNWNNWVVQKEELLLEKPLSPNLQLKISHLKNALTFTWTIFTKSKVISISDETDLDFYDFDHPNAFDFNEVYKTLLQLINTGKATSPVYSFTNNKRIEGEFIEIECKDVLVIEGILILHDPQIRALADLKIFIHCESDVALCRRLTRDYIERGRDPNTTLKRYNRFIRDDFKKFVNPQMRYCDVIISTMQEKQHGLDMVTQNVLSKISNNHTQTQSKFLNNKISFIDNEQSIKTLLKTLEMQNSQLSAEIINLILKQGIQLCGQLPYLQNLQPLVIPYLNEQNYKHQEQQLIVCLLCEESLLQKIVDYDIYIMTGMIVKQNENVSRKLLAHFETINQGYEI